MFLPIHRLTVSSLAVLVAMVGSDRILAQAGGGLEPGARFLFEIQYSNFWEINRISGVTRRGRLVDDPLSRLELDSMDQDPLFVNLELEGKVVSPGRYTLTPRVKRVRYFDARGRDWTLELRQKGAKEQALSLLEGVVVSWRREFLSAVDREMFEEQILGASLALLDGKEIDLVLDDPAGDAQVANLTSLALEHLPKSLPPSLHEHIGWFFREAAARMFAPMVETPRKGARIEARGIEYRVEAVGTARKRRVARLAGQVHHPRVGVYAKDRLTFDVDTGLVTEATATTLRDAVNGNTHRMGSLRWQVELKAVRAAPKSDADGARW